MTEKLNKLFVYGIFLSAGMRESYAMSDAHYAVVKGYKTVLAYGDIVEATPSDENDALTGLFVEVAPMSVDWRGQIQETWKHLDKLEGGYDRVIVETSQGKAFMYVKKGVKQ